MNNTLKNRLQYHVSGAIERGEAQAIVEIPALHTLEIEDRTNEIKEHLYTITVTFAVAVPEDEDVEGYLADAINETLREHQRHLSSQSCILDYMINGYKDSTALVEGYEEGDAFRNQ
jgi:hypothetical protein